MSKTSGNDISPGKPRSLVAESRSSLRRRLRVYAFVGASIIGGWLYYTVNTVAGLYDTTAAIERDTDTRERAQDAQVGLNEAEEAIDRYTLSGQGYDLSRHHAGRTSLAMALGAIRRRVLTQGAGGILDRAEADFEIYSQASDRTIAAWRPEEPSSARSLRNDLAAPAAEKLRDVLVELQQRFAQSELFSEESLKGSRNLAAAAIIVLAALILAGLLWLLADVNRRILGPCASAARALETLARGEEPPRLPDQSPDEIGDLGRHFNRLAEVHEEQSRLLEERDIESSVNAVLSVAATVNDLKGFGSRVLERVVEVSGASACVLYLPEADGSFAPAVSRGGGGFQDGHVGRDEAQRAAAQRRAVFLTVDPQTPTIDIFDGRILPRETAHIPLVYFDHVVGVLALAATREFSRRARTALTAIAPSLAVALANASANEQVGAQSRRLTEQNELLEEQRARIERTAQELQRASALKDRFLASVSHELRTPMTVILGFTGALLRGSQGELNATQRESLERVQRNARLLLGLINDVLDISKIEAGKMDVARQTVSPVALLQQIQADFGPTAARKGLKLETQVDPGLDRVVSDPVKITQILANLVGNALKFTESGSIVVRAQPHREDNWALVVSDTGIGIALEEQDTIFEEFRQGESPDHRGRGGTGLGLAIVRKLALVLGGTVSLESAPGKGSTFTVVLPRELPAGTPAPAERTAPDAPAPHARGTVLIVDDDESVRRLLAFELQSSGVKVLEAANGRDGLELARAEKPDVILLDVLMPRLDGWETLRALKDIPETRSIPVVILSVVENRAFGIALGAFDYLVKPVDRNALFSTLSRAGVLATSGYVLIVDDDPDVRALLEQELLAAGYLVRTAESGVRALEILEGSDPPTAILLDLMMPPPDGFEVLYRIRENPALENLRVVVVTARDLTPADEDLLSGSAQRIIRKGAEPSRLAREVIRSVAGDRNTALSFPVSRVLVVEDSPDIRVLVRMLLEAAGHEVLVASDGKSGVETALREKPDLVLMDLSLPILSGWEATRQIKSDPRTSAIPVLAVTAHAMHGDRERALAAGCDGFIAKPIDEETFEPLVTASLRNRKSDFSRSAETARSSAGQRPPPGKILIVDDQPEVASLLQSELEEEGHRAVVALNGREAIEISRREGPFDLAILDVMLGAESGYELAARLIADSSDYLPSLLMTAGSIDRDRGYDAGADDFIAKPIESSELKARVRSLLRIGRSIREHARARREHTEAYEKLAELDRLKSDFLSTVSHELRTPLNTIILLAHLIEREGTAPSQEERRLHDIGIIRESAETLLRMINNILDLAKIEAGQSDLHPERMDLPAFLEEMKNLIEPQARSKEIEIALETTDLPAFCVLDREKISRVLINLLSNAVKYTHRGRVVLRARRWQGSINFEVEDTGIGVPAHLVAAAFEPFRQIRTGAADVPRGTGLGLPISKQLVELMGGDLLFNSREGEGTRIAFTLPELPAPAETPDETQRKSRGLVPMGIDPSGKIRRILIVEDDTSSRYGLKSLLESEGYLLSEADSLAGAERVLRHAQPDVLILDITLPDGDGAQWLTQLQRRGELSFPVIALTGVTADEDRRRIESAGVCAVLYKPVNVALLFEALEDCLTPVGQTGKKRERKDERGEAL